MNEVIKKERKILLLIIFTFITLFAMCEIFDFSVFAKEVYLVSPESDKRSDENTYTDWQEAINAACQDVTGGSTDQGTVILKEDYNLTEEQKDFEIPKSLTIKSELDGENPKIVKRVGERKWIFYKDDKRESNINT